MSQEKYYQNLTSLFGQDLSRTEEERLLQELQHYPNGREIFEKLKDILNGVSAVPPGEIPDTAAAWQELAHSLNLDGTSPQPFVAPAAKGHVFGWLAAAAIAILLVSAFLLTRFYTAGTLEALAHPGEQHLFDLPDGSSVVVNSGSRLSYPERFTGEERRVFLEGEAYFSVRKDPAHPFVVVSENASTVVLGTRFSVYDRQGSLRVVVDEGSVRVTPQGLEAVPDILKAGQLLRFRHGAASAEIEAVAPNSLTAWQNGDIAFHQTPLDEIAAELSRRYNTPIEIGNLDPQRYSLTGTFPDQELPQILSSICLALNLNYHIREGGSVSIFKP